MQRIMLPPRPDWQTSAEKSGFDFHSIGGAAYWDETRAYRFTLRQIEDDIEDPTAELERMCYEVVESACKDERILQRLAIPARFHDLIRRSWKNREKNLYGRFDFAYDGHGPAKLYEYNADTPTSLFETGFFQWPWMEELKAAGHLPADADQFNSVQERLVAALGAMGLGDTLHLAGFLQNIEDYGTLAYLADCAVQAGLNVKLIDAADIGADEACQFVDLDNQVITSLFKLVPWEWLWEADAKHMDALLSGSCRIVEPAWKMVLSNKGLLALLWEMFPGHPNLLPAYFAADAAKLPAGPYVKKPLLSREGANVTLVDASGKTVDSQTGPYGGEGFIVQAAHKLPDFDGDFPVIGSWVVAGQPAGMGIREDVSPITKDSSRFVPHFISG